MIFNRVPGGITRTYISSAGLKTTAGELVSIYRTDDDMMIFANMRSHLYAESSLAEFQRESDERSVQQNAKRAGDRSEFKIETTNETAEIAGLPAHLVRLHLGALGTTNLWLTTAVPLAPKVAAYIQRGNAASAGNVFGDALASLSGIALKSEFENSKGEKRVQFEAEKVERRALKESEFFAPVSYRKAAREEVFKVVLASGPAPSPTPAK